MAAQDLDPNVIAREELAKAMIPTPEDIAGDLTPLSALFYLEQLSWTVLAMFTGFTQEQSDAGNDGAEDLVQTLNEIATITGMLDQCCSRIGLIPRDAVPPQAAPIDATTKAKS